VGGGRHRLEREGPLQLLRRSPLRSDPLRGFTRRDEAVVVVRGGPTGDGLGIFSTELPCGRFWGHDGGILDYGTIVKVSEDGNRIAVISGHGGAPSGPPPDKTALLCPSDATTTRNTSQ
jgi:hypothetical protein